MRILSLRLALGLLLAGAGLASACNKTCPGPRKADKGPNCHQPAADSTGTGKSS